ncbi:MAG: DUF1559 domain-containing protein, partial [bacterium]|nr:DUF1559 domain-containing protein [bacterium]
AILLPVFSQAREKARQAQCASNQKQIIMAILQYTQDWDETFPVFGVSRILTRFVPTYMPITIMDCPSDKTRTPGVDFNNYTYGGTSGNNRSYCFNFRMGAYSGFSGITPQTTPFPMSLTDLRKPAEAWLIADADWTTNSSGFYYDTDWNNSSPINGADTIGSNGVPYGMTYRHNDGLNLGFADGHVEWWSHGAVLSKSLLPVVKGRSYWRRALWEY